MKLNCVFYGDPRLPPLVILHGFLGSSRNWQVIAKHLAEEFYLILPDLRNHGKSPHSDSHTYRDMLADLEEQIPFWLPNTGFTSFHLLGHSMGGRLAMQYAMKNPESIESLVIVDMGVRDTKTTFPVINVALEMNLQDFKNKSYSSFVQYFQEQGIDLETSQFMVTNLSRNKNGEYSWQIPLSVLNQAQKHIIESQVRLSGPHLEQYLGLCLFVMGEESSVVSHEDEESIKQAFPNARIEWLPGVGHNPHFEDREQFLAELRDFL